MTSSATTIWIICAVVVAGLAVWLILVMFAARRPGSGHQVERRRGRVLGGSHVGGGRSVAPRRDAPVAEGEDPAGTTLLGEPEPREQFLRARGLHQEPPEEDQPRREAS